MPPDTSGPFNLRAMLRAWCLFALLLCANAALFALPHTAEAATIVRDTGKIRHADVDSSAGSFGATPAAGNSIVVLISCWRALDCDLTNAVADNQGNTYSPAIIATLTGANKSKAAIFYVQNIAASGTFTITVNPAASNNYIVWNAVEVSGLISTNALDVTDDVEIGFNDTSVTVGPTSVTTARNDIVFAVAAPSAADSDMNISNPTGYEQLQVEDDSNSYNGFQSTYKVANAMGAQSASWTFDAADSLGSGVIAAFKVVNSATLSKPPNNLGLVGYWSFNEGTGTIATDFSGNGNTGTLMGSPPAVWVSGKRGKALTFDGADDTVRTNSTVYGTAYSVAFWVKGAAQDDKKVYNEGRSGALDETFYFGTQTNGTINLTARDTDFNSELFGPSTGIVFDNTWHHVAFTDSTGTAKLYIDGVLDPSNFNYTPSGTFALNETIFGAETDGGFAAFAGSIDEVRTYNRTLSPAEVAKLYGSGAVKFTTSSVNLQQGSTLANGLVGHWTFDGQDITANQILDRSGQGNHGGFIGRATSSATAIGKLGQAFQFFGDWDTHVAAPNVSISGSLTAGGWVYPVPGEVGVNNSHIHIIGQGYYENEWGISLNQCCAVSDIFILWMGTQHDSQACAVAFNEWNHIIVTLTGTSLTFYRNGIQCATDTTTALSGTSFPFYMGGGNNPRGGRLDDVRVYNRVLTPAEIKQLYTLGTVIIRE